MLENEIIRGVVVTFDPTLPPPPDAAAIGRLFPVSEPARFAFQHGRTVQETFATLLDQGHLGDARRLLAHALPARRAIWWATLCLHHASARVPFEKSEEDLAFDASVRWVLRPSESHRRGAEAAGWAATPSTPAGILAMACFLAHGSISRVGLPPVYAAPHLAGRLSGVVVYLASVRFDPAHYLHHLRQYLVIGQEVASGRNLPPGGAELEPWVEPRRDVVADYRCCERVSEFLAACGAASEVVPGEALFSVDSPPDRRVDP